MATAVESARIGVAKYIVPFVFVYNPSLILEGPLWLTAISLTLAFVGVWGISVGLEGWCRGPVSLLMRIVVIVLSIALMYPPALTLVGELPGYFASIVGLAGVGAFAMRRMLAQKAA